MTRFDEITAAIEHRAQYTKEERRRLENTKRRVDRARKFMRNTCPASRHLHLMADALASKDGIYWMLLEEPEHCAETMYSVLESLWRLRTETGWPSEKDRRRWKRTSAKLKEGQ